jgi:hypothetical protein
MLKTIHQNKECSGPGQTVSDLNRGREEPEHI